jgi:hypothetical protein
VGPSNKNSTKINLKLDSRFFLNSLQNTACFLPFLGGLYLYNYGEVYNKDNFDVVSLLCVFSILNVFSRERARRKTCSHSNFLRESHSFSDMNDFSNSVKQQGFSNIGVNAIFYLVALFFLFGIMILSNLIRTDDKVSECFSSKDCNYAILALAKFCTPLALSGFLDSIFYSFSGNISSQNGFRDYFLPFIFKLATDSFSLVAGIQTMKEFGFSSYLWWATIFNLVAVFLMASWWKNKKLNLSVGGHRMFNEICSNDLTKCNSDLLVI